MIPWLSNNRRTTVIWKFGWSWFGCDRGFGVNRMRCWGYMWVWRLTNHPPQHKGMISGSAGIGRYYKISYTSHNLWKLLTEGVRSWELNVTASLGKHIICNKGEWASSQCYVTDNVLLLRTNMYLPFWLVKSAKP